MVATLPQQEWQIVMARSQAKHDVGPLARSLLRLRGRTPLTQVDVMRLADWGPGNSYYGKLETGEIRKPSEERVKTLERILNAEPGEIERVIDRRPRRLIAEDVEPYGGVRGGTMEIKVFPDEIVIRNPDPSTRRIVEHVRELSDRARLSAERSLLDLREQESEIAGEEEAQTDTRMRTKDTGA